MLKPQNQKNTPLYKPGGKYENKPASESEKETLLRTNKEIYFSESYQGYWDLDVSTFEEGYKRGESRLGGRLNLELEIFLYENNETGKLTGTLDCPLLDSRRKLKIESGNIEYFQSDETSSALSEKKIVYTFLVRVDERTFTFQGAKALKNEYYLGLYPDLTTLHFTLSESGGARTGKGTLKTRATDQARQFAYFSRQFLKIYGPPPLLRNPKSLQSVRSSIPVHTLAGIRNAEIEEYPFFTGDGLGLKLRRVRRKSGAASSKGATLLIHGLTSSCDMFIMPEHENLCNYLLDQEYEVWLLDFRMSNRFLYNQTAHNFSFDDVALYDMPAAIKLIREKIGQDIALHVICHCLGSVSFTLAHFSGLIQDRVDSVISNSASLFVNIPLETELKLKFLLQSGLLEKVLRIASIDPGALSGNDYLLKIINYGLSLRHHECDSAACHMISFMWGQGTSAVFEHENLLPETHERLGDLFGPTTFAFQRHVLKMQTEKGLARLKPDPRYDALPWNYYEILDKNKTPYLFITGDKNKVFCNSQLISYEKLSGLRPDLYKLKIFEGYGHQDVFMGRQAHTEIFPHFLEFWQSL